MNWTKIPGRAKTVNTYRDETGRIVISGRSRDYRIAVDGKVLMQDTWSGRPRWYKTVVEAKQYAETIQL